MKRMIAIALFAVAGFIAVSNATSQTPDAHFQTVQFSPLYLQIGNCNVNGVVYPVGQDFRVWGYDAYGRPWVIGWVNQIQGNVWWFHASRGGVFQVVCA